jgi:hypothetical protein
MLDEQLRWRERVERALEELREASTAFGHGGRAGVSAAKKHDAPAGEVGPTADRHEFMPIERGPRFNL